ncbi:MAG: hypothetical protein HFI34_03200 [Lachnospiraceae bacterium]|nr:hypothetical protein [Lachnospiraceae bacterium]
MKTKLKKFIAFVLAMIMFAISFHMDNFYIVKGEESGENAETDVSENQTDASDSEDSTAPVVIDLPEGGTKYVNTSSCMLTLEDTESGAKGIYFWTELQTESDAVLIECNGESKLEITDLDKIFSQGKGTAYFKTVDKKDNISSEKYTVMYSNFLDFDIQQSNNKDTLEVLPAKTTDAGVIYYTNKTEIYVQRNDIYKTIEMRQIAPETADIEINEDSNKDYYKAEGLLEGAEYEIIVTDKYSNTAVKKVVCDTIAPSLDIADSNNNIWINSGILDISNITELTSGINWDAVTVTGGIISDDHTTLNLSDSNKECELELIDYAENNNRYKIKKDMEVSVSVKKRESDKELRATDETKSKIIIFSPGEILFDFSNEESGIKDFKVTKDQMEIPCLSDSKNWYFNIKDKAYGTYEAEVEDFAGNRKSISVVYKESEIDLQVYKDNPENKTDEELKEIEWGFTAIKGGENTKNLYGNGEKIYLKYTDDVDPSSITIITDSFESKKIFDETENTFLQEGTISIKYKGWNDETEKTVTVTYDSVVNWKMVNGSSEIQSNENSSQKETLFDTINIRDNGDNSGISRIYYKMSGDVDWIPIVSTDINEKAYVDSDGTTNIQISEFFDMVGNEKKYKIVDIQIEDKAGNTFDTTVQYNSTLAKIGFDGLTDVEFFEQVPSSEANSYTYYIKNNISDISINSSVNIYTIRIGDEIITGDEVNAINDRLFGNNAVPKCEIIYSSKNDNQQYKTTIIKDLTAPTFDLVYNSSTVNNQWIQSSVVTKDSVIIFVQNLEDQGSGVNRVVFTLGDKTLTKTGKDAETLTLKELTEDLGFTDGKSIVKAEAYDNLNNKSKAMEIELNYDSIPPEISITTEDNNIWTDDSANVWIGTTDVNKYIINVKASDGESGIIKLEFSVNNKTYDVNIEKETPLLDYPVSLNKLKNEFTLQEGKNIIKVRAFDMADNVSAYQTVTLFYDSTPPEFKEEIVDSKVWTGPDGNKWIKAGTKDTENIIKIKDLNDGTDSTDLGSGVKEVVYELNGKKIENKGSNANKSVKLGELKKQLSLKEGKNTITIRVCDNVGNKTERPLIIYYDETAPSVSSKLNTVKLYQDGKDYWIKATASKTDVLLTVKAADDSKAVEINSGIGEIKLKVGEQEHTENITNNLLKVNLGKILENFELKQGKNTISITVFDNVGNASKTVTETIFYDTYKPEVNYKLNNSKLLKQDKNIWILSSAKKKDFIIDVSGTKDKKEKDEKVSGIGKIKLTLGNKSITRTDSDYKKKITLLELAEVLKIKQGSNEIYITAYDKVGNESAKKKITLYYDTKKPVIQASLSENEIWNNTPDPKGKWIKSGIKGNDRIVNINKLTDKDEKKNLEGSGISKVVYSLGENVIEKSYEQGKEGLSWNELKNKMKIKEGLNDLKIVAFDNVGNKSDEIIISFNYDKSKPTLKTSINQDVICNSDNGVWIKAGTSQEKIIIRADVLNDNKINISKVSGIERIEYKLGKKKFPKTEIKSLADAGITLKELKEKLGLKDGKNIIDIVAYDNVGNRSEKQTITINYDTKLPEKPTIRLAGRITSGAESGRHYGYFFNQDVHLLVQTSDGEDGSGIASINLNSSPISLNGDKILNVGFKGKLSLSVTDVTGNKFVDTEEPGVIIEDKELHDKYSAIHIEIPETAMKDITGLPLYNQEILPVDIRINDDFSGIRSVKWTVTSDEPDKALLESGTVNIDADGNVTFIPGTGENQQSIENSFLSIQQKDFNLVTKLGGTLNIRDNSNGITLTVSLTDNAQNTTTKEIRFSNDTTVPTVTISYDNNSPDGTYRTMFREERTATIRIQERNFRPEDVVVSAATADGKSAVISDWTETTGTGNNDDQTYVSTINYREDGEYTFNIFYRDPAGNEAVMSFAPGSESVDAFTIDRTVPIINVTYDNNEGNNGYFKDRRIATITINEHNFSTDRIVMSVQKNGVSEGVAFGEWTSNGDIHSTSISFDDEAQYTVQISYTDMAGNTAVQTINESFYVDKTEPEVIISGVESQKAYNSDIVGFKFEAKDFYFDKAVFNLEKVNRDGNKTDIEVNERLLENGKEIFLENITEDGIYQLSYMVTDKAGRTVQNEFRFSVNRNGSSYVIDSKATAINKSFLKSVENDIVIREVNVNDLDMDSILLILTRGSNAIELKEGADYSLEKRISENTWCEYIYTIKKSCFAADGEYSLTISSKDALGNVSVSDLNNKQADISFVVDNTLPLCNILNLKSDATYGANEKKVEISVSDNIRLAKVLVFLNGDEIINLSETELEILAQESQNISFDITSKSTAQNLEVVFEDKAGNSDTVKVSNFYVTTNPWIRFKNDSTMLILFLAVAMVIAFGTVGTVITLKKKHKNH